MNIVNIDRWVDLDSAEARKMERYNKIREYIKIGLEVGLYRMDKEGYMWVTKEPGVPVHGELDGKLVGLRYSAKAAN